MTSKLMGLFIAIAVLLSFNPNTGFAAEKCSSALLVNQIQSIESKKDILAFVSARLNEQKADMVVDKLIHIFDDTIGIETDQVMSEKQFFQIFSQLKAVAEQYDIRIETKMDTMGVFPEGLNSIKIAGFSEPSATNSDKSVNFAKRHELAHLFHVIAVRGILAENAHELSDLSKKQLEDFVATIEGGRNYLEFEKIVTDISGMLHVWSPVKSGNQRYGEKLKVLLLGLKPALLSGRVKFKNGWGIIEVYAKFLSKAPLVVGTSLTSLAVRMPFIIFATNYLSNEMFRTWVNEILRGLIAENENKNLNAQT